MNGSTQAYRYTQLQAERFVGRKVRTTLGFTGIVTKAHPTGDGSRILMHVWTGSYSMVTDNEHATIVRS